jgi:hypothetical protein
MFDTIYRNVGQEAFNNWWRQLQSMSNEDMQRHAMVGQLCTCMACFTCLAKYFYKDKRNNGAAIFIPKEDRE